MDNIKLEQETAIDVTGGVRSNVQPYYLEPNQMYYLKNVNLDQLGARRKRYGCSSYGVAGTECGGLAPWVYKDSTRYLAGFWNNNLFTTKGNYAWSQINTTGVSLVTNHVLHGTYGRLYDPNAGATITSTAAFVHSVYASTSDPTLSALAIIPESGVCTLQASVHPRSVEWWQGRLWMGGFADPDLGQDMIIWSTILNGLDIDTSNSVRIDSAKGDEIMKILPTRSAKPRMYIFKRHSIHAFDVVWTSGAQIPTTENAIDTVNSNVVLLTGQVGTVAPNSVVYASGAGKSDVFFLARDGVRSLQRVENDTAGGLGKALSEPIKDIIDRINWAAAEKATAAIYDDKLFMAIPVDGSSDNNTTIVYDILGKRWIGEYTLEPNDFITYNFNDKAEQLLGTWNHTTSELVGTATAYTSGRHIFHLLDSSGYRDPSNAPVEYEEQTRAYTFKNMGTNKRWNWMELELTPAVTTITLSVYYKLDDADYQLLDEFYVEPEIIYPIIPVRLPWNLDSAVKSTRQVSLMDVDVGKTLQIKVITGSPASFGTRTTRITAWPLKEIWE